MRVESIEGVSKHSGEHRKMDFVLFKANWWKLETCPLQYTGNMGKYRTHADGFLSADASWIIFAFKCFNVLKC